MKSLPAPAGYFGKLPCAGDFVSRRLPLAFVQAWDAWLSRSLAACREQADAAWLDAYLVSPFWRFALAPGLCGESGWAGVMMASIDRVGRAFPMTVAAPLHAGPFGMLLQREGWFAAIEEQLLAALHDDDVAAFDNRLASLPPPEPPAVAEAAGWRIDPAAAAGDGALLLDHLARGAARPCSGWATTGSPAVPASLLVCTGLPGEQQFAAFIDGRWREGGWAELAAPVDQGLAT